MTEWHEILEKRQSVSYAEPQ